MTVNKDINELLLDSDEEELISINSLLNKRVIVYGAGSGFYSLSTFILEKYKLTPYLVLDQSFDEHTVFNDIPALSATKYKPSQSEQKNSTVIVSIGNKNVYKLVKEQLKSQLGFKHIVWAFDIFEYSLHYTDIHYIENLQQQILNQSDQIIDAYELLADEESQQVYKQILTFYFKKKSLEITSHSLSEQYFPKDITLNKGSDCFIDCGAYTGDTVKLLAEKRNGSLETVICFEPDRSHFKKLVEQLDSISAAEAISFPCGVYDDEQLLQVSFSDTNSNISEQGNSYIQTVALDHVLQKVKPSYIKMDIESAEFNALCGARNLITENEPDLAISIYHKVEHLWLLPNLIASFGIDYQFYLRNYTSHISETVLYATKI